MCDCRKITFLGRERLRILVVLEGKYIMLNIDIIKENGSIIVNLDGELSLKTAPEFEKFFEKFENKKIILNVAKLEYISSAGLRSLVILIKKLYATDGKLGLVSLQGIVREIIEVSGFADLIKTFETLEEAKANL